MRWMMCWFSVILQICYFFYKNIAFGFTLFFYEAYASFSGQAAYNDWYLSFYNVFFTSLPVIALGVFDQDVSSQFCLKVISKFVARLFCILKRSNQKLGILKNFSIFLRKHLSKIKVVFLAYPESGLF